MKSILNCKIQRSAHITRYTQPQDNVLFLVPFRYFQRNNSTPFKTNSEATVCLLSMLHALKITQKDHQTKNINTSRKTRKINQYVNKSQEGLSFPSQHTKKSRFHGASAASDRRAHLALYTHGSPNQAPARLYAPMITALCL